MIEHYWRGYRRTYQMRMSEYANPSDTFVSYNLYAVHNEKLDGRPERTTAERNG